MFHSLDKSYIQLQQPLKGVSLMDHFMLWFTLIIKIHVFNANQGRFWNQDQKFWTIFHTCIFLFFQILIYVQFCSFTTTDMLICAQRIGICVSSVKMTPVSYVRRMLDGKPYRETYQKCTSMGDLNFLYHVWMGMVATTLRTLLQV